jgi:hypothetical protein
MIRFTCPKCHEDSYTAKVDVFTSCPYCGCVFSGRYGIEKREEKRIKREIPFSFRYEGQDLQASTMDFSDQGLGIEISDFPPLAQGDILELSIGDIKIKAIIIRLERLPDKIMAGLKRLN